MEQHPAVDERIDDAMDETEAVRTRHSSKSIVLFSDGTGNSSAKLFKTNVWRIYEAVDLGPASPGKRPQISYYDDGVGTSAFKPLAMLGGALGFGLKRNVLDIYRYACRNYRHGEGQQPGERASSVGDHLYGFGFSRGAFTMRIVIALIASQGLVVSKDERELEALSKAAYRAFRADFLPRKLQSPTRLYRRIRDKLYSRFQRLDYDASRNWHPVIRFVGVWDTVAAYGGPFVELTRAIDDWIFALSMPDYELSDRVQCARHALALDDERDSFQPLLWDEIHESDRVAAQDPMLPWIDSKRLKQVWFTGMHSDVGGGYPDESLSFVSLLWMLEEAKHNGLRTLDVVTDRFLALANSYGPIHDSRAGVGAYYRYQPRRIAAWLDPVDPTTIGLRDPEVMHRRKATTGLIRKVLVHQSVVARLASGTDRYAPIVLPERFEIVPPQLEGEAAPQADSDRAAPPPRAVTPVQLVAPEIWSRLRDVSRSRARAEAMEDVWDRVWLRRLNYFVTLAFTLFLAAMPLYAHRLWDAPALFRGAWTGKPISALASFLPGFASPWITTYASNTFYFLVFVAVIVGLMRMATLLERGLRDRARAVWKHGVDGNPGVVTAPRPNAFLRAILPIVRQLRTRTGYQKFVQTLKWGFAPMFVITPAILATSVWLLAGLATQVQLPYLENNGKFCKQLRGQATELTSGSFDFRTDDSCGELNRTVQEKGRYVLTFDILDSWYDASISVAPKGVSAGRMPWGIGYLFAPMRRVLDAGYLQPVLQIRSPSKGWFGETVHLYPLKLTQQGDNPNRYRVEFEAQRDGRISVVVNDAVPPFGLLPSGFAYFYKESGSGDDKGNRGTACLTIVRSDHAGDPVQEPSTPICGAVFQKAAASARSADSAAASPSVPNRS